MLGKALNVPPTTNNAQTLSPVAQRNSLNEVKTNTAMPPPPQQRQPPCGLVLRGQRSDFRESSTGETRAAAPTTTTPPQRINSANMQQVYRRHERAVPITRRGIHITMSKGYHVSSNQSDSGVNGDGGLRRSRSNGSYNSAATRSPLSLYGDSVYHSFRVCGAPDCDLCTKDASGRWRAAFVVHESWKKQPQSSDPAGDGAGGVDKPRRSLIPHACEHCRMPFIPKISAAPFASHEGKGESSALSESASGGDELDVSESGSERQGVSGVGSPREGGVVILEGSLAGGSAGSSPLTSSVTVGAGDRADPDTPCSPLEVASHRLSSASSSESQQSCISSTRSGSVGGMFGEDEYESDSFCSGDCKMSYMLSTPMALRRRRKKAEMARAAAQAALAEPQM